MSVIVGPTRPRKVWDVVLSIILLVFTLGAFVIGAFLTVFALAFTDNCPPETCDSDLAVNSVFTVGIVIALCDLVATIVVIVLLVLRRRAWWLAALALLLTIVGWIVGFALYVAAVT
jgi:uncharacterized BrkB/YihY/UPF0761 family membrane protein